ncbi:TetR family transcriptional regulator C-terminal domain-containing protein [Streptomyces decoyicus]|uniref:TetR family transcriptional regulator C-terminal domain-containing protein n=1 Tax=Streptomyces decoyicus TaxID=249567 RepID=UPI00363163BB
MTTAVRRGAQSTDAKSARAIRRAFLALLILRLNGEKYDAALSCAASEPVAAVRAFFDVTLERIADPELPDGCLIAQSAMAIPVLSPSVAAHAKQALGFQRLRLRAALKAGRLTDQDAEAFAVHAAAVNQSLAVMSRAGASPAQLLAIVGVTVDALSQALRA